MLNDKGGGYIGEKKLSKRMLMIKKFDIAN